MSGLYHHLRVEFPRGWLTRTTVAAPPAQTSTSRRCPACALATPRASWHRGVQGSETYVNSAANSDVLVDKARHSLDICRPQLELWLETHGLASRIPLPFASGTLQMLERGLRVLYLLPLGWAHVGLARNKSCSPLDARHPTVPDWDVFGNVGWLHVIEWRFRGCGGRPCGVGRLSVLCLFLGDAPYRSGSTGALWHLGRLTGPVS